MRILICDDHAVVRAGLRLILEQEAGFVIVGEAASGEELIAEAGRLRPDIVVTDLSMPGLGGLEALPRVRRAAPEAKILILTVHEDEAYFFQALEAGAAGYVLKGAPAEEFLAALRLVARGGVPIPHTLAQHLLADYTDRTKDNPPPNHALLSPREREVLGLVADGRANKEIAERLSISVRTVERYRASIMNKLGLHNRAELVAYAVRRGLLGG